MSIVCVGGLKLKEVVALLRQSGFDTAIDGYRSDLPKKMDNIKVPSERRHLIEFSKHVSTVEPLQTAGYGTISVVPGAVSYRKLVMIARMLTQVVSEEVREQRQWTYGIAGDSENYGSFHELSVRCKALTPQALDQIENVVDSCILSVSENESLFQEIRTAKVKSLAMYDTTVHGLCDNALDDLSEKGYIEPLQELLDEYSNMSFEDIQEALSWFSPERRLTLIVAP